MKIFAVYLYVKCNGTDHRYSLVCVFVIEENTWLYT